MTNGQSLVGSDGESSPDMTAPPVSLDVLRERVIARRRRARQNRSQTVDWATIRTRRQKVRMIAVSAGVLLLMAIGLYFELTRPESPPSVEGAAPTGAAVVIV